VDLSGGGKVPPNQKNIEDSEQEKDPLKSKAHRLTDFFVQSEHCRVCGSASIKNPVNQDQSINLKNHKNPCVKETLLKLADLPERIPDKRDPKF